MFRKNLDGAIIGSDATEPTAGSTNGNTGLRVEGAMTVPVAIPDSELADVLGDDEPLVQFDWGEGTLPSGVLELAARNLYFEAQCQGTLVYEPNTGTIRIGVLSPSPRELADLALLFHKRAKTWQPGSRGVKRWESLFIPACTIVPKGNADWTQRQHAPYRYSISMSKADIFPWGETFYDAAIGTKSAPIEPIESHYPYWLDIFKGDGVQDTFALSKTPITLAVDADATEVVSEARIIVPPANYTISTTPNIVFDPGSEPANGALVHVWYPIAESEL
jgi:hypothetical protein